MKMLTFSTAGGTERWRALSLYDNRGLMKGLRVLVRFVPQDFWIGIYKDGWRGDDMSDDFVQRTYVCILPMFPIIFERWETIF